MGDQVVWKCKEYSQQYIASGKNLDIIRNVNAESIEHRFDVLRCFFEEDYPALRLIQIHEIRDHFLKYKDIEVTPLLYMAIFTWLQRIYEMNKSPLSIEDAIEEFVTIFGTNILDHLIEEADKNVELRKKIMEPYFNKNDLWVQESIDLRNDISTAKLFYSV